MKPTEAEDGLDHTPRVGDLLAIEVATRIWTVGWVLIAAPPKYSKLAILDAFWDHKPTLEDARGIGLWCHTPDPTSAETLNLGFSLDFPIIGHRVLAAPEPALARTGGLGVQSREEMLPHLHERWRWIHDREQWWIDRRRELRQLYLGWKPPANLARWRYETPIAELGAYAKFGLLHNIVRHLAEKVNKRDYAGKRLAFRQAVAELDAFHQDHEALDDDAGELLLRRMVQIGHYAGIPQIEVEQLTSQRQWPAGPLQALNLPIAAALPTDRWREVLAVQPDRYSETGIAAAETVLTEARAVRAALGKRASKAKVLDWIRDVVLALNAFDEEHGLIETEEREELVAWVLDEAGKSFGGDPTERWRDW